jgi:signal transduction histidine kinase
LGQSGFMYAPAGLLLAGVCLSALTLVTIERAPQFSPAAAVPGGLVVLFLATWLCLLAAAAQLWWGAARRRAAVLLGLGGLAWLAPEWENPGAAPPLFAVGLLVAGMTPALVLHAALTWQEGRIDGRAARLMVLSGYVVCVGLVGLLPALVLDPAALGCADCPANPWLVGDSAMLPLVERLGSAAAAVWLGASAVLLARRAFANVPAQNAVQLSALGFLTVSAVRETVPLLWKSSLQSTVAGVLWVTASIMLAVTGLGAMWVLLTRRRSRRALGRIVVDLARGQQPGRLRDAFAQLLSDPTLELVYIEADEVFVNAQGFPVSAGPTPGRERTSLVHDGNLLALLLHASTASVPPEELEDLVTAAHLGLEHEALIARASSQERELRESGLRLLAARDAERARLERDLHDGAQQRLVSVALGLELLRHTCPSQQLEYAKGQLQLAIDELRAIAHGLAPPVLADAGLTAALRALAETRRLHVTAPDLDRLDPAVETTAYLLVERVTRVTPGSVILTRHDDTLRVDLTLRGDAPDADMADERVVALGGSVAVRRGRGTTLIELKLPVESIHERPASAVC